jgi:hypothetical protein
MGSVFKKAFTKPLPPEAEIIERKGLIFARWRDASGKPRTARLAKVVVLDEQVKRGLRPAMLAEVN